MPSSRRHRFVLALAFIVVFLMGRSSKQCYTDVGAPCKFAGINDCRDPVAAALLGKGRIAPPLAPLVAGIAAFRAIGQGLEPKSDKVTAHGYEAVYGFYLEALRENSKGRKFLEIGLGCDKFHGATGPQLWREWFGEGQMELFMAEFDADCVKLHAENLASMGVHALTGDQADFPTLDGWVEETGGRLDVIIDDGGHTNEQIYNTFITFWEHLLPGGLYFIEDMQVGRTGGISGGYHEYSFPHPIVELIKSYVDQLIINPPYFPGSSANPGFARDPAARVQYPLPPGVKFVACYDEMCVIGKCASDDPRKHCREPMMTYQKWKEHMLEVGKGGLFTQVGSFLGSLT